MTPPPRKEHIRTVIARNLDSGRWITGPTGEALVNAADVIRELLAALEEAETAERLRIAEWIDKHAAKAWAVCTCGNDEMSCAYHHIAHNKMDPRDDGTGH